MIENPPQAEVSANSPRSSARSWLWLGIGAALLPFALMRTVIPLTAWLAPVFLLRFTRTQRIWVALPALALVSYGATLIAFRGVLPVPQVLGYAAASLISVIPYAVDRLLTPRLRGVVRTLAFPAADLTLAFTFSQGGLGSMGASAYTQVGNLPLTQIVSVTGIWGLGFLIAWAAPVINELWEREFDLKAARRVMAAFLGVLIAVLLAGGAAAAFAAPKSATVQVAGLAPNRQLDEAAGVARAEPRPAPAGKRLELHARYLQPVIDDLFRRTEEAARGGARIVAWSEAASFIFPEDEAALIQRAREVASTEQIYLQISFVGMLPRNSYPFVDIRAIMIDPQGVVAYDYTKATEPLNDGNAPGPWLVPTVDTPYGRIATVICHDANFPSLVRQAGRADVDILLVPASDWAEVTEPLGRTAALRAIENGVSLFRPARRGTSMAVDYQGRQLASKADYFVADSQTTITRLPTAGVPTSYPWIGDSFAYLAIGGLVALMALALLRRRRA
jgi:apolipoprotein N-acyltransferase